jgi:signal transduction histidine kinase
VKYIRTLFSSMTGRLFVLLLGGMSAAALIASIISNYNNTRDFERRMDDRAADRLQEFITFLDGFPPDMRSRMLDVNRSGVRSYPVATPGVEPDRAFSKVLNMRGGPLGSARADKSTSEVCFPALLTAPPSPRWRRTPMPQDRWDGREGRGDMRPFMEDGPAPFAPPGCRLVSVTLTDGTPLRLSVETPRVQSVRSPLRDPAFIGLFGIGVVLLAYAAALRTSSPLRRLAQASTQLGDDLHRKPLEMTGPTEVLQAVAAFNSMQARLQSHFSERTQMLAAITHDLQTPLTRLRLRLERVKDPELRERLVADLQSMRALIDEGLELARTAETPESIVMFDLDSVLESLVEDAVEAGLDAEFTGGCGAVLPLRPMATRRIFANLLDNALIHGGSAKVRAERNADSICVFIRDNGPGIPEEHLARAFDPFFRAEESRSRETGGTGLGLTIARMLAAKIGATVKLRNHPDGGLEAQVTWKTSDLKEVSSAPVR